MSIKVSVIVPCYNQVEFLNECLISVLNQTYEDWECIIVNDGSTDETEKISLEWEKKDSRFVYLKKENGGLCSARNYGIAHASGKYILPLDSDDKIGSEYLERGIKVLEKDKDVGIVYCKAHLFGTENKDWILPTFDKKHLLCENLIFCSALYRKEDWKKIGGYDENLKYGWEDWEFWINMVYSLDKKVIKLNYKGFYYRIKESSMITFINKDKTKQLETLDYIYFKHKKLYNDSFGHPIISYRKIWKLENKYKILILYIKKLKSSLTAKNILLKQ